MASELVPIAGQYAHFCEFAGGRLIDEYDNAIIHCRCFDTPEFLAAQDKRAVSLDAKRVPRE